MGKAAAATNKLEGLNSWLPVAGQQSRIHSWGINHFRNEYANLPTNVF